MSIAEARSAGHVISILYSGQKGHQLLLPPFEWPLFDIEQKLLVVDEAFFHSLLKLPGCLGAASRYGQ